VRGLNVTSIEGMSFLCCVEGLSILENAPCIEWLAGNEKQEYGTSRILC
jgi:hypothetical protein